MSPSEVRWKSEHGETFGNRCTREENTLELFSLRIMKTIDQLAGHMFRMNYTSLNGILKVIAKIGRKA